MVPSSHLSYDAIEDATCQEFYYHVRTHTMEDLETGLSPTRFWYTYALPLSHSTDAVRHALCALGAAHRTFKLQGDRGDALQSVHKASLEQYNTAIRCLDDLISTADSGDTVVILTCCVVFITLENMLGRYAESLRHLKAGSSLLSWLVLRQNDPKPSGSFLNEYSETLCRLGDDVWGYIREMVAPDLNTYSAELRPLRSHEPFASVTAAEQALHEITKLFEADTSVVQRKIRAYAQYGYCGNKRQFMSATKAPPQLETISFSSLRTQFHRWSQSFDLFRSSPDQLGATPKELLRTQALAVDQALWTGWLNCDDWRDYREDDLKEIIVRAETLVQNNAFERRPVFTFDGSLILDIAMACVCSADPVTQSRAILLLRSFHRREGIWDSQELADVLRAMTIATSSGMVKKEMLPWDVPHLARLMDSLGLAGVQIPSGPLSLIS